MINKAFVPYKNKGTLILSSIATIIGVCLLLIAIQIYIDVNYAIKNKEDSQYLVIKKKISTLNTVGVGNTTFSKSNIENIKKQDFVLDLAPFKSGSGIEVLAVMSLGSGNFPPFSTLAFFESIPDKFIDVDTKKWNWKKGEKNVPIILPNTFLDAYNYGIAPSMGVPQASKSLISSVKFRLEIRGYKKDDIYYGSVVNFSDRINSILVPESFLEYINKTLGNGKTKEPSRIIISTTDNKNPAIKKYLSNNNYETNKEYLKENIIQTIANSLSFFFISVGVIIVFLAVIIFILYNKIIINKSYEEIKILIILGYTWQVISKEMIKKFIRIYGIITLISFSILIIFKIIFNSWIANKIDLEFQNSVAYITFAIGLAFILLLLILNYVIISNSIKHIAKMQNNVKNN